MTDDADVVLIGMGTVSQPRRARPCAACASRAQKVGYVNLRWFRPFPTEELRECLRRFKAVGVIDRDFAHGSPDNGGVLCTRSARASTRPKSGRQSSTSSAAWAAAISIADAQKMYETHPTGGQEGFDRRIRNLDRS